MQRRVSIVLAAMILGGSVPLLAGANAKAQSTANADQGPRPAYEFMRRAWERMTADDRAALFEAHLAALRVGLQLTPDQEKLWPALEAALRDAAREMIERRRVAITQGPPADPVAGLRRAADRLSATGEALRRIADAAQPLYSTLSDDQKRRLPILLHGLRPSMAPARLGRDEAAGPSEPRIGWGLPE